MDALCIEGFSHEGTSRSLKYIGSTYQTFTVKRAPGRYNHGRAEQSRSIGASRKARTRLALSRFAAIFGLHRESHINVNEDRILE
jgi:hypothetical protein